MGSKTTDTALALALPLEITVSVTRAGAGGIRNAGTGVQKMFLASSASAHSPSGKWIESLSAAPTLFIRQSR